MISSSLRGIRSSVRRWLGLAFLALGTVLGCRGSSETTDESSPYQDHCQAACELEGSCIGTATDNCEPGCGGIEKVYSPECLALFDAVAVCETSLTCDGIRAFLDDLRGHAECGPAYTAFIASCGYPGGMPPVECESYCDAIERCVPDQYYGGCADACAQSIVVFGNLSGQPCADAYRRTNACLGGLSCMELEPLFEPTPTVPSGCEMETLEFLQACR